MCGNGRIEEQRRVARLHARHDLRNDVRVDHREPMSGPMLSVVMPVLDIGEDLAAHIASLRRVLQTIDPDGELIVAGQSVKRLLPSDGGGAMLRPIETSEPGFGPAIR